MELLATIRDNPSVTCAKRYDALCNGCEFDKDGMCDYLARISSFLLANGVIVPPYEPMPLIDEGDRVLCPICETDLMGRYIGYDNTPTVVTCYECGAWIDSTKALDREEAEKALAEREGKG